MFLGCGVLQSHAFPGSESGYYAGAYKKKINSYILNASSHVHNTQCVRSTVPGSPLESYHSEHGKSMVRVMVRSLGWREVVPG